MAFSGVAPTSGAVDYVRSPRTFTVASTWKRGASRDAVLDFAPLATTTKNSGLCALIYGEPFTSGLGVHNIHQNQGDPLASQWAAENGIWQGGLTVLQQSPTDYVAFMNKFTSQSYTTDDQGHPI